MNLKLIAMKTTAINYELLSNHAKQEFNKALKKPDRRKLIENLAYLMALETGRRVGELLNLKYSDFEKVVIKERIRYKYTCEIPKRVKKLRDPETKRIILDENGNSTIIGKTYHTGLISNDLYNLIEQYKKAITSLNYSLQDDIFYNYQSNTIYTRQWLHKQFKIVGNKLGFENFGVHSIRKASAIHALNTTGSLSFASRHLGHARATTTDAYLGQDEATYLEKLSELL